MDSESGEVDIRAFSVKPDDLRVFSSLEQKGLPILDSILVRYVSLVQPECEGGNVALNRGPLDSFDIVVFSNQKLYKKNHIIKSVNVYKLK